MRAIEEKPSIRVYQVTMSPEPGSCFIASGVGQQIKMLTSNR
jgi:hypothetical protein